MVEWIAAIVVAVVVIAVLINATYFMSGVFQFIGLEGVLYLIGMGTLVIVIAAGIKYFVF